MLKYKPVTVVFIAGLAGLAWRHTVVPLPWWTFVLWTVAYLGIVTYGVSVLSAQFFLPVRFRGAASSNSIAITFDDGPLQGNTEKLLDILNASQVKAAFFCIGKRVAESPALTERLHREGHLVGNHSYFHANTFDLQSAAAIARELQQTDEIITKTIGVTPLFFRPPYGVTNPGVAKAARRRGYKVIGWSVRSFDTMATDPEALMQRVTRSLRGGDVVLFHDYCDITVQILPAFIAYATRVGLKIVRVDELLNEKAYA